MSAPGTGGGMLPRRGPDSPTAPSVPSDISNHLQEMMMSNEQNPAQGSAAPVKTSTKFKDMNFKQKIAYIGKAVACVITFGFAFPNIFIE
jgi:hypothetical protein